MKTRPILIVTAALTAPLILSANAPAAAPFFAGPTYDAATNTGYVNPSVPFNPGAPAGLGAVANPNQIVNGTGLGARAFRWDSAGTLTPLGGLGTDTSGYTNTYAYASNNTGLSVGYASTYDPDGTPHGDRAVRWAAGSTTPQILGHLGLDGIQKSFARAYAVNASGTAVGDASKPANIGGTIVNSRAVRWDAGTTVATELGTIGTDTQGLTVAHAYAVNASGAAVGTARAWSGDTNLGDRATRWDAGQTAATELGNLGVDANGVTNTKAYAINAAGTAAGSAEKYSPAGASLGTRAVRWNAGTTAATELASLGTTTAGVSYGGATGVMPDGTVVGYSYKYNSAGTWLGQRAVRWAAGASAATELAPLATNSSGFSDSTALSANSAGLIAGSSGTYTPDDGFAGSHAVVWGAGSDSPLDLNRLLSASDAGHWRLEQADAISDLNWVVGSGFYDPDGAGPADAYARAFSLKIAFAGDADGNDRTDFNDFLALQAHFGQSGTTEDQGDFNYDGVVNFNDFLILQSHFGQSLTGSAVATTAEQVAAMNAFAASVPEPTMLAALAWAVGIVGMRPRRR